MLQDSWVSMPPLALGPEGWVMSHLGETGFQWGASSLKLQLLEFREKGRASAGVFISGRSGGINGEIQRSLTILAAPSARCSR